MRQFWIDLEHRQGLDWARLGRYRKRKAMDCGNPQCGVCHSDKYPKRDLTTQEMRAEATRKEQMG